VLYTVSESSTDQPSDQDVHILFPKGKMTTSRKKRDTERSLPFSDDKWREK
jgi:hypothetical protein